VSLVLDPLNDIKFHYAEKSNLENKTKLGYVKKMWKIEDIFDPYMISSTDDEYEKKEDKLNQPLITLQSF